MGEGDPRPTRITYKEQNMTQPITEHLTTVQAADYLGVSRQRLESLARKRRWKHTLVRGHNSRRIKAYPRALLDEYVNTRTETRHRPVIAGHLTSQQVADRLHVTIDQVSYYCRKGYLPSIHVENRLYIPEGSIEGFTPPKRGRPPKRVAA